MFITWDEPKRISNLAKHGLDFASLDEAFFLGSIIVPANGGRHMAIGRFGDGTIAVVFVYLGTEALAAISMRKADKNERKVLT
ncbi:MAG: BrnT family toxin [Pseudaminobacter sp.]|nr:BrnT family toxin [Pseudaminobacter sp.]